MHNSFNICLPITIIFFYLYWRPPPHRTSAQQIAKVNTKLYISKYYRHLKEVTQHIRYIWSDKKWAGFWQLGKFWQETCKSGVIEIRNRQYKSLMYCHEYSFSGKYQAFQQDCPVPGSPGKVPGRDGTGKDLDTLKVPWSCGPGTFSWTGFC